MFCYYCCYFIVIVTLVIIPLRYLWFKHFHNYNPILKISDGKKRVGLGGHLNKTRRSYWRGVYIKGIGSHITGRRGSQQPVNSVLLVGLISRAGLRLGRRVLPPVSPRSLNATSCPFSDSARSLSCLPPLSSYCPLSPSPIHPLPSFLSTPAGIPFPPAILNPIPRLPRSTLPSVRLICSPPYAPFLVLFL